MNHSARPRYTTMGPFLNEPNSRCFMNLRGPSSCRLDCRWAMNRHCYPPDRRSALPEDDVPWGLHNKRSSPFPILAYSRCEGIAPSGVAAFVERRRAFPGRLSASCQPQSVDYRPATDSVLQTL